MIISCQKKTLFPPKTKSSWDKGKRSQTENCENLTDLLSSWQSTVLLAMGSFTSLCVVLLTGIHKEVGIQPTYSFIETNHRPHGHSQCTATADTTTE